MALVSFRFQLSGMKLARQRNCGIVNSYPLQQLKVLLPAHACCTHVASYDVNIDFFVFRDNNSSFCSGAGQDMMR